MKMKLRVDDNFRPCTIDTDDELFPNGIFEFNITKMHEYIIENQDDFEIDKFKISDYIAGFSNINEAHLESVDISQPIVLAEISPGKFNVIDGNHRVEKARRMGVEKLNAYKLTVSDHIKFLTSKKAYIAYVNYWNSKQEDY